MRLFGRCVRLWREDAFLEARDADFVAGSQEFQGYTGIHGLERRKHVKAGEVLCSGAVSSAEQLEQVFAFVDRYDLVEVLVGRVGLECRERVRELGDEVLVGVLCWTCILALCGGLFVLRLLGDILFAGDGWGQLELGHLGGAHGEVHVYGIFALFDGLQSQNGVERSDIIAVRPFLKNHLLVDFDDFYGRMVVFASEQQQ